MAREQERAYRSDAQRAIRRKKSDAADAPGKATSKGAARRDERLAGLAATVGTGLTVGPANDAFEREAESVAQRVTSGGAGGVGLGGAAAVQRRPAAAAGSARTASLSGVGSGAPLSGSTRAALEPGMQRDFSSVRLHSDKVAADANAALGSQAFTYRNHVFLGAGTAESDHKTMAHELTHVAQQGAAPRLGGGSATTGVVATPSAGAYLQPLRALAAEAALPEAALGAAPVSVDLSDPSAAIRCMGRAPEPEQGAEQETTTAPTGVHSESVSRTTDTGNVYTSQLQTDLVRHTITVSLDVNFVREGTWTDDAAYTAFVARVRRVVGEHMNGKFKVVGTPSDSALPAVELPMRFQVNEASSGYRIRLVGGQHGGASMSTSGGVIYELGQASETVVPDQTIVHEFGHCLLGASDEYANPAVPGRTLTDDHSMMANYYAQGIAQAEFKVRHVSHLLAPVSAHLPGYTCRIATV